MSEAARQNAFWSYKPGYKLTPEESDAFDYGWRAAMRFMAQPRIPTAPSTGTPLPVGPSTGDAPKEHNPHGLVAFYTDAPVCAMCGGRGVIGSVSREDPGGNQEPCPECNPEGLPRGCNV